MAGSISLSLSQQFDPFGRPYGGGKVYFIQAGTVATPKNAYQDLGLTLPWANPYTLLSDGRIPQVYFSDGYIKVRITDQNGVEIFNQDNIPVVGPSSGGGGGGGVDPTTVLQTGWMTPIYGTGVITGFVRANGRTLGSATSGATERANADTTALFVWLWNADANLAVSGGRGVSGAADFAANKTIALPDFRGRALGFLDDMGNSAAGLFTGVSFSSGNATTLGSKLGIVTQTIGQANLPNVTLTVSASGTASVTSTGSNAVVGTVSGPGTAQTGGGTGVATGTGFSSAAITSTGSASVTGTTSSINTGVTQQALPTVQPTMLATIYLKL